MTVGRTLFEKIWDDHVVVAGGDDPDLLYVDLHLVHEVTSPQAFEALQMTGRSVRRPDLTLATADHGTPTINRSLGISDPLSRRQVNALLSNCEAAGITVFGPDDPRNGIVHVIGPEQINQVFELVDKNIFPAVLTTLSGIVDDLVAALFCFFFHALYRIF